MKVVSAKKESQVRRIQKPPQKGVGSHNRKSRKRLGSKVLVAASVAAVFFLVVAGAICYMLFVPKQDEDIEVIVLQPVGQKAVVATEVISTPLGGAKEENPPVESPRPRRFGPVGGGLFNEMGRNALGGPPIGDIPPHY